MDRVVDAITQLWPIILAAAGGVGWWLTRSDRREARMIATLQEQVAAEKARADEAEALAEKRIAEANARAERAEARALRWSVGATAWYGQLREHNIEPVPIWGDVA